MHGGVDTIEVGCIGRFTAFETSPFAFLTAAIVAAVYGSFRQLRNARYMLRF